MAHENTGLRVTGQVYIQVIADTEQPVLGPLPAEYIGATPKSDIATVVDTREGKRGQVLFAVTNPKEPSGKLTLLSAPRQALAISLLGNVVNASQIEGAVAVGTAYPCTTDYGVQLAHRNVSSLVVSAVVGMTPAATVDVDYEILSANEGIFRPITGGILDGLSTVYVTYEYGAISEDNITLGTANTIHAKVILDGTNDTSSTGERVRWECADAILTPTGDINLIGKDPVKIEFNLVPQGSGTKLTWPTYN